MNIAQKTLRYLKAITAETVSNAKSGHTGSALGASSILLALFKNHYRFDISDTDFLNRDRFVMSAGHVSALYYTTLSMFGFDVSLQDLKEFRKYGSKTPGHPEYGQTNGVEVSTGPLGQGIANAVGMAIAESMLEERFNTVGFPIIDNYTYCYCGDGDIMEGVAQEACSLAGTLRLNKFILLYDSNDVTIDGRVNIANRENVAKKFKAMGFNVIKVNNGNSFSACSRAIARAKKSAKPTIIIFKTIIGIGTMKEGISAIHGMPLPAEELKIFKKKLGVKDAFYVPTDVRDFCLEAARKGKMFHEKWNQLLAIYANSQPELYKEFVNFFEKKKIDFDKIEKNLSKLDGKSTREANGVILNEFAERLPQLIGGTADVALSTKTLIEYAGHYSNANKMGKNMHFGIREHAMGAICNGIALYEDFIVFDSTFLAFSNYMLPALRMRAMMKLPALSFFTHDSLLVGEDGPSHQPIEQIASLRSIIGLNVFRPCDANEIFAGYKAYLKEPTATAFILTRQNVPAVKGSSVEGATLGGYIVKETKKDADVVIYASGSEVALAMAIAEELKDKEVSVVSMPCLEIFDKQPQAYKTKVLQPKAKLKVAIECSNDASWYKYINADKDLFVKVEDYAVSGDGDLVYSKAGFDVKAIVKEISKRI